MREITFKPDFESWRAVARQLLREGVPPSDVRMMDCEQDSTLWTADFVSSNDGPDPRIVVPRQFLEIAKHVACHINPLRWQLLYSVLWRLRSNRNLLKLENDDAVKTILFMEQQVLRDLERMQGAIKFDRIQVEPGDERLIAWHRPDYAIVELAAPYFAERFPRSRWAILTPYRSAHWEPEDQKLEFDAGVPRFTMPGKEELKQLWLTQRGASVPAMRKQPQPAGVKSAERQPQPQLQPQPTFGNALGMPRIAGARSFLPSVIELPVLNEAIKRCEGCELHA